MPELLLGVKQRFPQRCMECHQPWRQKARIGEDIVMLDFLWGVNRWESKIGDAMRPVLLLAIWLCRDCARRPPWYGWRFRLLPAPEADEEEPEPIEIRLERERAERTLGRRVVGSAMRQRLLEEREA